MRDFLFSYIIVNSHVSDVGFVNKFAGVIAADNTTNIAFNNGTNSCTRVYTSKIWQPDLKNNTRGSFWSCSRWSEKQNVSAYYHQDCCNKCFEEKRKRIAKCHVCNF